MPEEFYYGSIPTCETFPEPEADYIIDADGVYWFRYADQGWIIAGDSRIQPWSQVQKWGPFTW